MHGGKTKSCRSFPPIYKLWKIGLMAIYATQEFGLIASNPEETDHVIGFPFHSKLSFFLGKIRFIKQYIFSFSPRKIEIKIWGGTFTSIPINHQVKASCWPHDFIKICVLYWILVSSLFLTIYCREWEVDIRAAMNSIHIVTAAVWISALISVHGTSHIHVYIYLFHWTC